MINEQCDRCGRLVGVGYDWFFCPRCGGVLK